MNKFQKLFQEPYESCIQKMSLRAKMWRKANADRVALITFHYSDSTKIVCCISMACQMGLVRANEPGAELICFMIDENDDEPTIAQVRTALEMD